MFQQKCQRRCSDNVGDNLNEDTTEVNDMRLLCLVFSWTGSDAVISILRFVLFIIVLRCYRFVFVFVAVICHAGYSKIS